MRKSMYKKLVGIVVLMLLIATALQAVGTRTQKEIVDAILFMVTWQAGSCRNRIDQIRHDLSKVIKNRSLPSTGSC